MAEPITAPEPPLNQEQREAIFDFLLLGMYADQFLKDVENTRLYELISSLGWDSYQDPTEYADTATARVRAAAENPERTRAFLEQLSAQFATDDVRNFAMILFLRLIESDQNINVEEDHLYATAKAVFGV